MSVLLEAGRVSLAKGLLLQDIYLAWGTGDASWDQYENGNITCENAPTPSIHDLGLTHEIGRKKLLRGLFAVEDENGELQASNGRRYRASETPTSTLFLEFLFDYTDGGDTTIREVGVFIGCAPKDTCPPDQTYFTPDEFEDLGVPFTADVLPAPNTASPAMRTKFAVILKV